MNIIEIKDVVKVYNEGKDNAVRALDGATLTVSKGESLAIMGVSGSGKSTLLHILGCLDTMTGGQYLLNGEEISGLASSRTAKIRNEQLGFILQSYGLIEQERVYNNVKLPLLIGSKYKGKEIKSRVHSVLEWLGIGDLSRKKVRELSGGQKQRVAIARAIVNDPDIIFADEPTSALDSYTAEEIMNLFKKLQREGKTVIVVTHDINVAKKMDRTVYIVDGKIRNTPKKG